MMIIESGARGMIGSNMNPATTKPAAPPVGIPIAISARHVHLTQATLDALFGAGHVLRVSSRWASMPRCDTST
jgi:acetate kinase